MIVLFEPRNIGFFTGNANNYGVSNRYNENIKYPLDKLGVTGSSPVSPNGFEPIKQGFSGFCCLLILVFCLLANS